MFFYMAVSIFIVGFFNSFELSRKNLITFLLATEIMFFGLEMLLMYITFSFNISNGFIYSFSLIFLIVCESVVGLGICVYSHNYKKDIYLNNFSENYFSSLTKK